MVERGSQSLGDLQHLGEAHGARNGLAGAFLAHADALDRVPIIVKEILEMRILCTSGAYESEHGLTVHHKHFVIVEVIAPVRLDVLLDHNARFYAPRTAIEPLAVTGQELRLQPLTALGYDLSTVYELGSVDDDIEGRAVGRLHHVSFGKLIEGDVLWVKTSPKKIVQVLSAATLIHVAANFILVGAERHQRIAVVQLYPLDLLAKGFGIFQIESVTLFDSKQHSETRFGRDGIEYVEWRQDDVFC